MEGRIFGLTTAIITGAAVCGVMSLLMNSRRRKAKRAMKRTGRAMYNAGTVLHRLSKEMSV